MKEYFGDYKEENEEPSNKATVKTQVYKALWVEEFDKNLEMMMRWNSFSTTTCCATGTCD